MFSICQNAKLSPHQFSPIQYTKLVMNQSYLMEMVYTAAQNLNLTDRSVEWGLLCNKLVFTSRLSTNVPLEFGDHFRFLDKFVFALAEESVLGSFEAEYINGRPLAGLIAWVGDTTHIVVIIGVGGVMGGVNDIHTNTPVLLLLYKVTLFQVK